MQLARVSTKHFRFHVEAPSLQPMQMGTLVVTESPVALAVTAILVTIMIAKVPESAAFFLGVLLFGALTGFVLWRRHRSGF
jgi:hypothetical protein